ncbi:hypothetical protein KEM54_006213 [Ascosphaera aggregata]|nr:hypothetical protein KEM54_006213 [Ascosphaera aggregata]
MTSSTKKTTKTIASNGSHTDDVKGNDAANGSNRVKENRSSKQSARKSVSFALPEEDDASSSHPAQEKEAGLAFRSDEFVARISDCIATPKERGFNNSLTRLQAPKPSGPTSQPGGRQSRFTEHFDIAIVGRPIRSLATGRTGIVPELRVDSEDGKKEFAFLLNQPSRLARAAQYRPRPVNPENHERDESGDPPSMRSLNRKKKSHKSSKRV